MKCIGRFGLFTRNQSPRVHGYAGPRSPTHRIVATSELTGRAKTRNGDTRPSAPLILRSRVACSAEGQQRRQQIVTSTGQTGRLCEAGGYLALNNG
jgi:hypothetical protein